MGTASGSVGPDSNRSLMSFGSVNPINDLLIITNLYLVKLGGPYLFYDRIDNDNSDKIKTVSIGRV
jgi:hypothetical protein